MPASSLATLAAAMWLTIRRPTPALRARWPAGRHAGAVLAVQSGSRPPGRAAGPDLSAGAPRLTGSDVAILNDASAGNTP